MKNSEKESERSSFFPSHDIVGSSGSIFKSVLASDTEKELSKEFVNNLKSLFSILDHDDCGYIKLSDVESNWCVRGASFSVMTEYLREASMANGLVNFETLCMGLKLAVQTLNNIPSLSSAHKDVDWASDSSEDSFRLHDVVRKDLLQKLEKSSLSGEQQGTRLAANTTNMDLASIDKVSTSKVYFDLKKSNSIEEEQDGLKGGSSNTVALQKVDMKSRSSQVEEELRILKNGLTVIENARKWYFKRYTAVQEEKLLLQQSDKNSLEQFQYEMVLHKTRRKELNLDKAVFKCYKENIQELNKYMTKLFENPHDPLNTSLLMEECLPKTMELQQLKKEILEKNSRIAQLEKEKSALIRDLFQIKAAASGD